MVPKILQSLGTEIHADSLSSALGAKQKAFLLPVQMGIHVVSEPPVSKQSNRRELREGAGVQ